MPKLNESGMTALPAALKNTTTEQQHSGFAI
jgi:hypothetical protein